jgi:hypothetical protein
MAVSKVKTLNLVSHHQNGQARRVFEGDAPSDAYTIWIHNGGAQDDTNSALGHYSGMRGMRIQQSQPDNSASEESHPKRPRKYSSDESSDDNDLKTPHIDDFFEGTSTEHRNVILMVLAKHRSLDEYDADDGPDPSSFTASTTPQNSLSTSQAPCSPKFHPFPQ